VRERWLGVWAKLDVRRRLVLIFLNWTVGLTPSRCAVRSTPLRRITTWTLDRITSSPPMLPTIPLSLHLTNRLPRMTAIIMLASHG
jgi:hypothetical protein